MSGPENEYGTWPSYTCPNCGAQDEEGYDDQHRVVCSACGAVDGEGS